MAWLTNVLERVVSDRTKAHEMHTLMPSNWTATSAGQEAKKPNLSRHN